MNGNQKKDSSTNIVLFAPSDCFTHLGINGGETKLGPDVNLLAVSQETISGEYAQLKSHDPALIIIGFPLLSNRQNDGKSLLKLISQLEKIAPRIGVLLTAEEDNINVQTFVSETGGKLQEYSNKGLVTCLCKSTDPNADNVNKNELVLWSRITAKLACSPNPARSSPPSSKSTFSTMSMTLVILLLITTLFALFYGSMFAPQTPQGQQDEITKLGQPQNTRDTEPGTCPEDLKFCNRQLELKTANLEEVGIDMIECLAELKSSDEMKMNVKEQLTECQNSQRHATQDDSIKAEQEMQRLISKYPRLTSPPHNTDRE